MKNDETAWLIERHDQLGISTGIHYYALHERGHWWTADANNAHRFDSEDAARAAALGGDIDGPLKIAEHMWISGPRYSVEVKLQDGEPLPQRLRSSAEAFRKHTVYDSEGDPLRLIVQADECDEAAEALAAKDAEIARLRGALEPSCDTKAAYMGEFSFTIMQAQEDENGEALECPVKQYVPWTTIKEIMATIAARATRQALATDQIETSGYADCEGGHDG